MGSVIVYALSKAFTKVVYDLAGHFMWNGSNFFTNCIFKLFNRLRAITVYLWLEVPPEEKNHTDLNQVCHIILPDPVCVCIYIYIYIYIYISWLTIGKGAPKTHFPTLTTPRYRAEFYSSTWIASLILDPYLQHWVSSKEASSTILQVFSVTWPVIEPQFPGPLANTLTIMPMKYFLNFNCFNFIKSCYVSLFFFLLCFCFFTKHEFSNYVLIQWYCSS